VQVKTATVLFHLRTRLRAIPSILFPQETRGKPPNPLGKKLPARDGDGRLVMRYPLVPWSFQSLNLPNNTQNNNAHRSHANLEGFPNP